MIISKRSHSSGCGEEVNIDFLVIDSVRLRYGCIRLTTISDGGTRRQSVNVEALAFSHLSLHEGRAAQLVAACLRFHERDSPIHRLCNLAGMHCAYEIWITSGDLLLQLTLLWGLDSLCRLCSCKGSGSNLSFRESHTECCRWLLVYL